MSMRANESCMAAISKKMLPLIAALLLLPATSARVYAQNGFWIDEYGQGKTLWQDFFPNGSTNDEKGTYLGDATDLERIELWPPGKSYSNYAVLTESQPSCHSAITFTLPYGTLSRVVGSCTKNDYNSATINWTDVTGNFDFYIFGESISFIQDWWSKQIGEDYFTGWAPFNAISIEVYSPHKIFSEERLRLFLEHAIDDVELTLTDNINLKQGPLIIKNGQDITLNLNGYSIDRGLTDQSAVANGSVFIVENGGKLTIKKYGLGKITGGNTTGSGGAIYNSGTCVISGGTITGNKAKDGGAIYNAATGTLTIDGGRIEANSSSDKGGGIMNQGKCTITQADEYTSGSVANNTAAYGGGIWNDGTIEMTGGEVRMNSAGTAGGGIYNKGTTTVDGVSIGFNHAHDGGGIYNEAGANSTVKVLGGSIYNNGATVNGGGGITNKGILVVGGGSITGNTSAGRGAGIYVGDDSGNNAASITMYGNPVIKGNISSYSPKAAHDLYLNTGKKIKLSSAFTTGADIRITCEDGYSVPITDGGTKSYVELHALALADAYIRYSSVTGNKDDAPSCGMIIYNNELARLPYTTNDVTYLDKNGSSNSRQCLDLSELKDTPSVSFGLGYNDPQHPDANDTKGWFVLPASKKVTNRLNTVGDVNMILADGATLTAEQGIDVSEASSLTVYAQSLTGDHVGKIVATTKNTSGIAAIGGGRSANKCGDIRLYGGNITATGNNLGAGIGGNSGKLFSTIEIWNATVNATGGEYAPGIGSGAGATINIYNNHNQLEDVDECQYKNSIIIHSGNVTATGGKGGAGIGGGSNAYFLGNILIEGGIVTAKGTDGTQGGGAGIGSGEGGSCYLFRYPQATPRERQANITITGGEVYADGGKYAAAIGGGAQLRENPDLTSPGTYEGINLPLYQGGGAKVNITGGKVRAITQSRIYPGAQAFGHGGQVSTFSNLPVSGPITLFDEAMVEFYNPDATSELEYKARANERINKLRGWAAIVEQCDHYISSDYELYPAAIINAEYHSKCKFCLTSDKKVEHDFNDPNNYNKCAACGLVSLPDDKDNTDVLAHYADGGANLFVLTGRTFKKNGTWHTLCLPFPNLYTPDPLSGVIAMELTGAKFSKGVLTLNFTKATKISALKPYIVRWEKEVDDEGNPKTIDSPIIQGSVAFKSGSTGTLADPEDVSIVVTDEDGGQLTVTDSKGNQVTDPKIHFKGSFKPITWEAGTPANNILLLGADNGLFYPDGLEVSYLNSFRAYFELEGLVAGDIGLAPFVRSFRLDFGDKEETGIMETTADHAPRARNMQWYTLDGQRLSQRPTQPGLYIHQGRKVIIK